MKKEELKEIFAIRLRKAMDRVGMNAQALAKKCDVGEGTIWKYLDPENPNLPTMYTLYKMCVVLGFAADYFLFGGPYDGQKRI